MLFMDCIPNLIIHVAPWCATVLHSLSRFCTAPALSLSKLLLSPQAFSEKEQGNGVTRAAFDVTLAAFALSTCAAASFSKTLASFLEMLSMRSMKQVFCSLQPVQDCTRILREVVVEEPHTGQP